jgi:S-adenosylmethionine hydrolase
MATRSIVFLSDFGLRNEWVGTCHVVLNRIAPESPILDLTHGIPPLDVRNGALVLSDSLPYIAADGVVLAVVDPSVGRERDIAVETVDGRLLVGPDNGILAPSWLASGGVARAVSITSPDVILGPAAPTFHARDVLAPAAAHLARGMPLDQLGEMVDPQSLEVIRIPEPGVELAKIECEVLDLNRFGNVQLNVREAHVAAAGLEGAAQILVESQTGSAVARCVQTYGDLETGEWGLLVDSRGWLPLVRGNPANAAEGMRISTGALVWLFKPA